MIKSKLLFCAEGVTVDRQSNNVSAFNIIEQLNFQNLPVVWPKMVVLSLIERDEGDKGDWNGGIRIILADKEIADQKIVLPYKGTRRSRYIMTVGGLPITQPGKLEITLYSGEDNLMSYIIDVVVPEAPTIKKE